MYASLQQLNLGSKGSSETRKYAFHRGDIDVGPEVPGVALLTVTWPSESDSPLLSVVYDNTGCSNPADIDPCKVEQTYSAWDMAR